MPIYSIMYSQDQQRYLFKIINIYLVFYKFAVGLNSQSSVRFRTHQIHHIREFKDATSLHNEPHY